MNPIVITTACFSLLLSAGFIGAVEVVGAAGSPPPGVVVSCDDVTCWVASGHRAPHRFQGFADDPIELPEAPVTRLLVLTDQGDPLSEGSIRWVVDDLPENLRQLTWRAEDGRLDLVGPPGLAADLLVAGYAPATVRLEPVDGRPSVVLERVRTVVVKIQPARAGELLLAATSDLHLLSVFNRAAKRWQIPESGELEMEGLPGNQPMLGVVSVPGWAPVVGPLPAGHSEITIALAEGLSVNGTVHNEEGLPVVGAEVIGIGTIERLDRWKYTQRTVTDSVGRFVLTGLLEGPVVVRAWKEGFAEASRNVEVTTETTRPVNFDLTPGIDLEVVVVDTDTEPLPDIVVRLGSEVVPTDANGRVRFRGRRLGEEVDLGLDGENIVAQRRTVEVNGEEVVLTVSIGGAVQWPILLPDGVATNDVLVRWSRRNEEGRETATGTGKWDDALQSAVVSGLPPGVYIVSVRIPSSKQLLSDPVAVALGEVVVLASASPESGSAVFGRVVDSETGSEIAGARVEVEEGSPKAFRDPAEVLVPRTSQCDADGRFRVGGLSEREHRVRVEAAGKAPAVIDEVVPEEGGTDLGVIKLGKGLTIEGLVVDRQRRPIASAPVTVREPQPYVYFPEAETSTDRAGRFRIERLFSGEWKIEVNSSSGRVTKLVQGWDDEVVEVELTVGGVEFEAQILRGDLPAPAGVVSVSSGGSSASGVVVLVDRGPGSRDYFGIEGQRLEAVVDADGRFTIDGIEPGAYTVAYNSADGRYAGSVAVSIPDVPRHMTIVRLPSGSVEGMVVDPDERSVSGADVRFLPSAGGMPRSAYSDGAGAYRIDGLSAGHGEVVASHDSFEPSQPAEVEIEDDVVVGPVILSLGSKRESGLKVRIVTIAAGASGAPVSVSGTETRLEFTDFFGLATFAGLPEGVYHVCGRVFGGAAGCLDRPLEVAESGVSEADLGLNDGGWVEVISPSSIGGGRFQVVTEHGAELSRVLFLGNPPAIDGSSAVIGPLIPGRYQVSCSSCPGRSSGTVNVTAGATAVLDLR